jgi:hypothetical protein
MKRWNSLRGFRAQQLLREHAVRPITMQRKRDRPNPLQLFLIFRKLGNRPAGQLELTDAEDFF